MNWILEPWPWYIAGPMIGFTVPILLLIGNKSFGISSNLRHICAICFPANIPFFKYNWRKEIWNLFFAIGITIGAFLGSSILSNPNAIIINSDTIEVLTTLGISDFKHFAPSDLFSFSALLSVKGFICIVVGGFLVGFGTRYASGCTSGHSIMGLSTLQWASLVATISFMIGGFIMTWFIMPIIFK